VYPELVLSRIPEEAWSDPNALHAALAEERRQYPRLFDTVRRGSADGGAGRGQPPQHRGDLNSIIRRQLKGR